MTDRNGWARKVARLAALAAVGVVLGGTSTACRDDPEVAAFDAATSCGPAGVLTVVFGGEIEGCARCSDFVSAEGAEPLGLPSRGEVIEEGDAPPPGTPRLQISTGRFVLAGPVPLPGASPPLTVDRVCRMTLVSGGVLAVRCSGPAPESACEGTLTVRPEGAP